MTPPTIASRIRAAVFTLITLLTLLSGAWLLQRQFVQLAQDFAIRGTATAGHIARQYAAHPHAPDLAQLLHDAHDSPDLIEFTVVDAEGNTLARIRRDAPARASIPFFTRLAGRILGDSAVFRSAVPREAPADNGSAPARRQPAAWITVEMSRATTSLRQAGLLTTGVLLTLCGLFCGALLSRFRPGATVPQRDAAQAAPLTESSPGAGQDHPLSLNTILGFGNLLLQTNLDSAQRKHVQMIRKAALDLLARSDTGMAAHYPPATRPSAANVFNVSDWVADTLALVAPAVHDKGLELVHFIYADVPEHVAGDAQPLRAALIRCIEHIVALTARGDVIVRLMLEDEQSAEVTLRLAVTANGLHLHLNDGECESLLVRMNASPRGPGESTEPTADHWRLDTGIDPAAGTTFHCILPYARADSSEPPAERADTLAGRRVLLCDPHPLARLATRHLLARWGMDIAEADDPARIPARLTSADAAQRPPDFVVLGLSQPLGDPASVPPVLQSLRCAFAGPVVVLASTADPALEAQVHALGRSACLSRPVRRAALCQALLRLWSQHGAKAAHDAGSAAQPREAGPHVLVADDDAINRRVLSALLHQLGARVTEAEDGEAALRAAAARTFDLILMDLDMPKLGGREAAARIRAREEPASPLRIVGLSACIDAAARSKLLAEGFDDLLAKPVAADALRDILHAHQPPAHGSRTHSLPPQQPEHAVYDHDESVRLAGGQQQVAAELLEMLLAELPAQQDLLHQTLHDGRLPELARTAHKLHGSTCYCGVPALRAAVARLEAMIGTADMEAIAAQLERLDHEIERLLDTCRGTAAAESC